MASEFPGSPNNLKGALVVFEAAIPVPTNLIVFQYNPEEVKRRIGSARRSSEEGREGGGGPQAMLPPQETFELEIELDAADQLEFPGENPLTVATGLHPTLAALELLLYPPSDQIILNKVLTLAGASILRSARSPFVLLVWGPARVLPVLATGLRIQEQAFDQLLNPIRAEVTLSLRALSYRELQAIGGPAGTLGLVNQIAKEVLARLNGVNAALNVTVGVSF